ncbi:sulfatase [bacterium]|nr:sulfatase [Opitutales bacterium]MDB2499661.1 sulfatase [bacterium]
MKPITLFLVLALNVCIGFAADKPNILFIAIDDMRPEFGCYGSELAVTPNLDKLAGEGLLFENAYCQQAICSPSRASLMTGARPDTIGVIENYTYFRDANPDIVTLPQHLWANGYETTYAGKIYHGRFNDPDLSWSREPVKNLPGIKRPTAYAKKENMETAARNRSEAAAKYDEKARQGLGNGPAYEAGEVADHFYTDGYNTQRAIATLKEMVKNPDKPFFLGLGFKKPHLNWIAPKKYWDYYDPEDITLAEHQEAPVNGATMGLHASFELRVRHGIPKDGPIGPELAHTLWHAYLACTSYVDAQIGYMIDALEEAGVRDNTIIIVWGDHGWHLGDMGVWGKATNYEIATRVPLIISAPSMTDEQRGAKSAALVELIDMYPTLCELTGIDIPDHLEGTSFVPLLEKPDRAWKKAAFSQFPNPALREWAANPLSQGVRETFFGPLIEKVEARIMEQQGDKWDRELFENDLMGYAMRTNRYRFVIWKDYTDPAAEPLFFELYDHKNDPNETKNIASKRPKVVANLLKQFNAGWKAALPKG